MTTTLFKISEISTDLFADAILVDRHGKWIFGSFLGNETTMHEFIARLTLPQNEEGGIDALTLEPSDSGSTLIVSVAEAKRLSKLTARTPNSTILGALCHAWIYDPVIQQPDKKNLVSYILSLESEDQFDLNIRLWNTVSQLCPLPLLDHWKSELIPLFFDREWITPLTGFGIAGYMVEMPDAEIESIITIGVQQKILTMDENKIRSNNILLKDFINETAHLNDIPVITPYSREEAIDDGLIVEVSEVAEEAGIDTPVVVTRDVWESCVKWSKEDCSNQLEQDEGGRLWDVLYMLSVAMRTSYIGEIKSLVYEIYRVPRDGFSIKSKIVSLKAVYSSGDNFDPVITVELDNSN